MFRRATVAIALSLVGSVVACRRTSGSPKGEVATRSSDDRSVSIPPASAGGGDDTASPAGAPVPSGSMTSPARAAEFAIYLSTPIPPSLVTSVASRVATRAPGMKVETKRGDWKPPTVVVFAPDLATYAPPTGEQVRYFGRGLSASDAAAVTASAGALVLTWVIDADPAFERLRTAEQIVYDAAVANRGFIWDEYSRETFTPDSWRGRRLETWEGDLPEAERHFVIHYYEKDGHHRAVTVGLLQLGLPDLVIPDVPLASSSGATTVIDAVAQLLVEGATVGPKGALAVDLDAIRQPHEKATLVASSGKVAAHRATVTLVVAKHEEGDSDNRECEIRFDGYPGATEVERESAAIASLVGSATGRASRARDDDPELAAVTRAVQARLPSLATAFRNGLAPGDRLDIKAPFATDSGSVEWMWFTVTTWQGGVVKGNLLEEPFEVKSLHAGAVVEVKQSAIADYMWRRSDGSIEGGESSKILMRREGQTP